MYNYLKSGILFLILFLMGFLFLVTCLIVIMRNQLDNLYMFIDRDSHDKKLLAKRTYR